MYLGIRHLSPNGAFNVRKYLDEAKPKVVLIEGPSDFTPYISDIANIEVKPPFAILAYTLEAPIKTVIYPFAEYSPEYQAILWCNENNVECKFIDLPSNISLALEQSNDIQNDDKTMVQEIDNSKSIYEFLDEEYGDYETFYESHIEHNTTNYFESVDEFGKQLRLSDPKQDDELNITRERYMKMQINATKTKEVVIITGAYHTEGLKNEVIPFDKSDLKILPQSKVKRTLMPYTYFKLSTHYGYGAGNKAPAYYHMMWETINNNDMESLAYKYITMVAREMRKDGHFASSAQVIDAINLANSLAMLNGNKYPVLRDMQDALITCIGEESYKARALIEVGTKIGSLPKGVSSTATQQDFDNYIKELKLKKYVSVVQQDITLDLRENIRAKTEKGAYLDLNRSFFLNKLSVLGINFGIKQYSSQSGASWKEIWSLYWDTEIEIKLIEASLIGESIDTAVINTMHKQFIDNPTIDTLGNNILNSLLCGLAKSLDEFVAILQAHTIDTADFVGIASCIKNLYEAVSLGNLRKISIDNISEIIAQLYLKATFLITNACYCTDDEVQTIVESMDIINKLVTDIDFIDNNIWLKVVKDLSLNTSINPFLSGYCMAILIERHEISNNEIEEKLGYYLSYGMNGEISANWFEGLCMKNHAYIITNISIWQHLDNYITGLNDEEFKRVLLFLRRAFTRFTSIEKDNVVESLKYIWQVDIDNAVIQDDISTEELDLLMDFDFDDI